MIVLPKLLLHILWVAFTLSERVTQLGDGENGGRNIALTRSKNEDHTVACLT